MSVTRASSSQSESLDSKVVVLQEQLLKALNTTYHKAFSDTYQPRYNKVRFIETKKPLAMELKAYCQAKLDSMEKMAAFIELYHRAIRENAKVDPKRWFDRLYAKRAGGELGELLRQCKPGFDDLENSLKSQLREYKNFLLLKFEFLKLQTALAKQSKEASILTAAGFLLTNEAILANSDYYLKKLEQKRGFLEDYRTSHPEHAAEIDRLLDLKQPDEVYDKEGQLDTQASTEKKRNFEKELIDYTYDINCELMNISTIEYILQGNLRHLSLNEQVDLIVKEEIFRNFADPLAETLTNEEKLYYWKLYVRVERNKSNKHATRCVENFHGRNEMEQEISILMKSLPTDHDKRFLNAELMSNLNSTFREEKEDLIPTIIEDIKTYNSSLIDIHRFEAKAKWVDIFRAEGFGWNAGLCKFMSEYLITPLLELEALTQETPAHEERKVMFDKDTASLVLRSKEEKTPTLEEMEDINGMAAHTKNLFHKAKNSLESVIKLKDYKREVKQPASLSSHTIFAQHHSPRLQPVKDARSFSLNN